MRELFSKIDKSPSAKDIALLAEVRIQQSLCFRELKNFNLTGRFVGEHPLVVHKKSHRDLELLKASNPEAFLEEYARCKKNVQRYESYIKNPKRKKDVDNNRKLLNKHRSRLILFSNLISEKR